MNNPKRIKELLGDSYQELQAKVKDLERKLEVGRKALEWYAREDFWDDGGFEGEESKLIFCENKDRPGYALAKSALEEMK